MPAENREHDLRIWARGTHILDNGSAAQPCTPHRRTPRGRRETRAHRAIWQCARRDHKRYARGSVAHGSAPRLPGPRASKAWGGGGKPGKEGLPVENHDKGLRIGRALLGHCGTAQWARGARNRGRRSAAQPCRPQCRTPQGHRETRAKRAMRHGARRGHKRQASNRVAHGNTTRSRGRRASKAWGGGGQPADEALPAKNHEKSWRIGRATRASWDIAARAAVRAALSHNARQEGDARAECDVAWRAARSQAAR